VKHKPALPDVNVLIALFDPDHPFHEPAHKWFGANRRKGWATCPATLHGVIRILSNPSYPSGRLSPAEVVARLQEFTNATDHEFWPDSVSLLESDLFDVRWLVSSRHVTDTVLLGQAVRHGGVLVTFDTKISLAAVRGATKESILILNGALAS